MLGQDLLSGAAQGDDLAEYKNPLAPKAPHHDPDATACIFLYMYGGPSQVDTFDYKPDMYGRDNQTVQVKTFGRGGHKNERRARLLHATPVLGHIARDISRDISTIYYVLTILLTLLVLAIQTWGLAALVLTAVAFVPVVEEEVGRVGSPAVAEDDLLADDVLQDLAGEGLAVSVNNCHLGTEVSGAGISRRRL
jgi:hypothetical protein